MSSIFSGDCLQYSPGLGFCNSKSLKLLSVSTYFPFNHFLPNDIPWLLKLATSPSLTGKELSPHATTSTLKDFAIFIFSSSDNSSSSIIGLELKREKDPFKLLIIGEE